MTGTELYNGTIPPVLIVGAVDTKFAVTVCGPPIVTVVDGALELATWPVHPVNAEPLFAVATIGTAAPEL
jgi:hypothetical protein